MGSPEPPSRQSEGIDYSGPPTLADRDLSGIRVQDYDTMSWVTYPWWWYHALSYLSLMMIPCLELPILDDDTMPWVTYPWLWYHALTFLNLWVSCVVGSSVGEGVWGWLSDRGCFRSVVGSLQHQPAAANICFSVGANWWRWRESARVKVDEIIIAVSGDMEMEWNGLCQEPYRRTLGELHWANISVWNIHAT